MSDANALLSEEVLQNRQFAIAFTVLASFSTGIGGIIVAFGANNLSKRRIGHMLSFSTGVMLYLSFVDLFNDAREKLGPINANLGLFLGISTFAILTAMIPETGMEELALTMALGSEAVDDDVSPEKKRRKKKDRASKARVSISAVLTCVSISLHNIPEGIAVYLTCLKGIKAGLPLAIAMMIHNIPEGMAVACPIYVATKSKWKAFQWSLGSGLFELVGLVLFECFFTNLLTPFVMDFTLAVVAGVMLVLCLTELLPETLENVPPREAVLSNIAGMFLMFISKTIMAQYVN